MLDLQKANTLFESIIKENTYISPISLEDRNLFEYFFQKEPHTYGNSWTYVIQGVYGIGPHNLGYKYYDGKNLSVVCIYPKIEHPETLVMYWVRPMGLDILNIISDFSSYVLKAYNIPTYVKKIFADQYDYLLTMGFSSVTAFPWHSESPAEDDTFPELIFDLETVQSNLEKKSSSSRLYRSYRKMPQLKEKWSIVKTPLNFIEHSWEITNDFFKIYAVKSKNFSNKYDYYNMIFGNQDRNTLQKNIVYLEGEPLAFEVYEKISEQFTCRYAQLVLRDRVNFLTDYLVLDAVINSPTKYLNLGGSENKGIHGFKNKFGPSIRNQMYWATKI